MKRIKMNEIFKTLVVVLAAFTLVCSAVVPSADAALPAPNWMPGFPMLAGPQIILMWGPVPGAVKYHVYLDGKKIGESPAMQIIHPAPNAGGEYKFTVRAVDASGAESPDSQPGIVKIIMVEPPKELQGLVQGDRVSIRWNTAPGAIIYDVLRRKKGEADFQLLQSVQDTKLQDATAEANVAYEYAVASKDNTGKSSSMTDPIEVMVKVVVKEAGFEGYKMNPLPVQEARDLRVFYGAYPMDIHHAEGAGVVSASGKLYYHENFPGDGNYRVLFERGEAEPGSILERMRKVTFRGVFIDDEGMVWSVSKNKIYRIDPVRETVESEISLEAPERGVLSFVDIKGNKAEMSRLPRFIDVVVFDDTILATDNENSRVVALDMDGQFITTLGWQEDMEEGATWLVPKAGLLSVSSSGFIFVNSFYQCHVFDAATNEFLYTVGTQGDTVGQFASVNGQAWDDKGRIWIADAKQGVIQIFEEDPDGDEKRPWAPFRVLTNEKMKGNPNVPKPVSLTLDQGSTPETRRIYILSSPTQSLYVFNVLWDKAPELGTFEAK